MKVKNLGDITEKFILKSLKKAGENYISTYRLSKSWINIVGQNIATMVRIHEVKNDGCIILKLTNTSYSAEVNGYKTLITGKVNMYLGTDFISKIVIIS
jgi:hypothetical protein